MSIPGTGTQLRTRTQTNYAKSIHSFKKLRDQPAQNVLALSVSMFVGDLLFCFGLDYSSSHSICVIIATAAHFFHLVELFWLNVLCFDVCREAWKVALSDASTRAAGAAGGSGNKKEDKKRFKVRESCSHCTVQYTIEIQHFLKFGNGKFGENRQNSISSR